MKESAKENLRSPIRISQSVQELLRCPRCHARLEQADQQFKCTNPECTALFPIIAGVPVLINEESSIFSIDDIKATTQAFLGDLKEHRVKDFIRRLVPKISSNLKAKSKIAQMEELLLDQSDSPRVLVIGGGILGPGMESLTQNAAIELVDSDVSFGPRTILICDAHAIPFEDGSFDGVIAQSVLEHVVDPYRCSDEIHRVLKDQGLLFAETPLMQQVHAGRYDFTRFTHLGHRRLFRRFEELDSGAASGPGMALAWSYQHFLLSFTTSKRLRMVLRLFSSLTAFWLKYCDRFLIDKPGALDAASAVYFMGRKSGQVLLDRDLVKGYRGAG
ncbi:MAG: methyltransferase domain-containing protein [Anaerolineales bacterium]|nr:methyltransferase domain-containing protein [Anaerolineales bacterium]